VISRSIAGSDVAVFVGGTVLVLVCVSDDVGVLVNVAVELGPPIGPRPTSGRARGARKVSLTAVRRAVKGM
jgi:hypothetical protein